MSGVKDLCSTEQIAINYLRDPLPRNVYLCTQNYTWVSRSLLIFGSSPLDQFKGPRLYLDFCTCRGAKFTTLECVSLARGLT